MVLIKMKETAEDKGTGNKEKITITNDQNRLTPEDIERMINDADKFAEEDAKLKSRVEARNELESYAYSLKNQIGDKEKLGGKLSDEEKTKIEEIVNEKIAWLEEHQVFVICFAYLLFVNILNSSYPSSRLI